MQSSQSFSVLEDPSFRAQLLARVRRRVPWADAEDVVQSALAEAALSVHAPRHDKDALVRWIWGVLRNKVADVHRRRPTSTFDESTWGVSEDEPVQDWLRWVERELPEGPQHEQTLEWMMREGEGESLETIADEANLPAPRVRQRVSRLRRHLRSAWAREVAALAAVGVLLGLAWWLWPRPTPLLPTPEIADDRQRVYELRRDAETLEQRAEYKKSLELLERARALDPAEPESVRALRERVERALRTAPAPVAPAPSSEDLSQKTPTDEWTDSESAPWGDSVWSGSTSTSKKPPRSKSGDTPKPTSEPPRTSAKPSGKSAPPFGGSK